MKLRFWRQKIAVLFLLIFLLPFCIQAAEQYPRPLSEYAEETGPGETVFLSYPKYYRDNQGTYQEVDTRLQPSADPGWDYGVSTGVWKLKIRKDGSFQAEHEGDVFAYRLNALGFGQGGQFQKGKQSEPDYSQVSIVGNSVRWNNVFKDVDLVVRYIHDILKVDVVVKKEYMRQLRAEVKAGKRNPEEYLTARFDIPEALLTSRAKRGKEEVNLYDETVPAAPHPLEFVKGDKTVHKLRPAETYVLDAAGEPILPDDSKGIKPIDSKQTWQLRRGKSGLAEVSAKVGDLADAPEGDVVIDPSMSFGAGSISDTYVERYFPATNYGSSGFLRLGYLYSGGIYYEKRILLSVDNVNLNLGNVEHIIHSAEIKLSPASLPSQDLFTTAQGVKATKDWSENAVNWNSNVTFDSTFGGTGTQLPATSTSGIPITLTFDVSKAFLSHYNSISAFRYGERNPFLTNRGFLLKLTDTVPQEWIFRSTESAYVDSRPRFVVTYTRKTNNIPGDPPTFYVSLVQNYNNPLTTTETSEMLTYAQRLLAERDLYNGVNNPPYEYLQPIKIVLAKNVVMDSAFPSTLLWSSPSDSKWRNRLSEERVTRVGLPEYAYLYDLSDPVRPYYRTSLAYSLPSTVDQYPLIFCSRILAQIDPLTGKLISGTEKNTNNLAHEFLHELGHSVGLNHMHCQDRNGIHGSNRYGTLPLGSAGSAFDSVQCYYYQKFVGLRNRGNIQPGETYPDPDNFRYGIPNPVVWKR